MRSYLSHGADVRSQHPLDDAGAATGYRRPVRRHARLAVDPEPPGPGRPGTGDPHPGAPADGAARRAASVTGEQPQRRGGVSGVGAVVALVDAERLGQPGRAAREVPDGARGGSAYPGQVVAVDDLPGAQED